MVVELTNKGRNEYRLAFTDEEFWRIKRASEFFNMTIENTICSGLGLIGLVDRCDEVTIKKGE